MKLSSSSLFHFLKKSEWLLDIISSMEICPRFVLEHYPSFNEKHLINMKCFCDIPLSAIKFHTEKYGNYGIGVTKEFAYRNYISPVFYYYKHSASIYNYMSSYTKEGETHGSIIPYLKHIYDEEEKQFLYEEREWRYTKGSHINVTKKSIEEINKISQKVNSEINAGMRVELNDIQYLFIRDQEDLPLFFNKINSLKISNYDKDLMKSKIITSKQIFEDF